MTSTIGTTFKRQLLSTDVTDKVTAILQSNLTNLIDLALLMKQAHWNVIGKNFRSVHLQLDEIIATTRDASDDVAERIAALGVAADGRSATVAQDSELMSYAEDFVRVDETVERVANAMKTTLDALRAGISELGELDPVSEDLLIAIAGPMEKHLWMLQAQEA